MTKLCPRGKRAAKKKFKVYPSAYANSYASKICAGKIKDPSGVKRKDFKGPKPSSSKVASAAKRVRSARRGGEMKVQKAGLGMIALVNQLRKEGKKKGRAQAAEGMKQDKQYQQYLESQKALGLNTAKKGGEMKVLKGNEGLLSSPALMEALQEIKQTKTSKATSKLLPRGQAGTRITPQSVKGLDNIFKEDFKPDTRTKGAAIVPSFRKEGDLATGRDRTRADVKLETKYGDFTVGGTKTKTPYGSGDEKRFKYNFKRTGEKGFADFGGGIRQSKDFRGDSSTDYFLQGEMRYELSQGGFSEKPEASGSYIKQDIDGDESFTNPSTKKYYEDLLD